MPRRKALNHRWFPLIALSGGALTALSLPPWGWWPLAFIGTACLDGASRNVRPRRSRAGLGFAFGLPWMLIGMAWMWFLTAPGYVIAATIFAGFHAVAAAVAPPGRWGIIGRPAAHTIVELVRWNLPFGGVPLATVAHSLAGSPLIGLGRIGGMLLLTWVVFQVGALIAGVAPALSRDPRDAIAIDRISASAAGAVAVVAAVAFIAPDGHAIGETLDVAAVQGGGRQGTSALEVPSSKVTQAHLDATATIEPDPLLDVVIWPENSARVKDQAFADSPEFAAIADHAARLDVPIIAGPTYDSEYSATPSPDSFVNAQLVVTPERTITDVYEKVHLVPFGEYVPMRTLLEALGVDLSKVANDSVPGHVDAELDLPDGRRLGVMISWEVFFGDRARAAVDDGAGVLINPTNGASYTGTIVQTQQIASSRLRAAETGRWVVQVSPTGFSAFISPDGSVYQRTALSEQTVIRRDIPLRAGATWYSQWGDLPALSAIILAFATAHYRSRRRADLLGVSADVNVSNHEHIYA